MRHFSLFPPVRRGHGYMVRHVLPCLSLEQTCLHRNHFFSSFPSFKQHLAEEERERQIILGNLLRDQTCLPCYLPTTYTVHFVYHTYSISIYHNVQHVYNCISPLKFEVLPLARCQKSHEISFITLSPSGYKLTFCPQREKGWTNGPEVHTHIHTCMRKAAGEEIYSISG